MSAAPPIVFVDYLGRSWNVAFTDQIIAEIRDWGEFDLDAAAAEDDPTALIDFTGDWPRLAILMTMLCHSEKRWTIVTAAGEAGWDFREGLPHDDNPTITRAIEAKAWALARWYPDSVAARRLVRMLPRFRRELRRREQDR